MRKQFFILFLTILLGIPSLGFSLMSALADEIKTQPYEKYYTSIEIQRGDSLWSIAGQYGENSGMTTAQYVKELKSMNRLKEDTIHSGEFLTIMYFVSASDKEEPDSVP